MSLVLGVLVLAAAIAGGNPITGDFRLVSRQSNGALMVDVNSVSKGPNGDMQARTAGILIVHWGAGAAAEREPETVAFVADLFVNCATEQVRTGDATVLDKDMNVMWEQPGDGLAYPVGNEADQDMVDFICGTEADRRSDGRTAYPDVRSAFISIAPSLT
ncbi:hypothetical protein [Brevundimonas lenta]|uniref:Uncharacterized protein n=1 Tax=Brevundimonas lenta TaxID=424796 RepID=A0A7W6JDA1_9CAUL|nr:hypothetical protein [Brevundimonas lenta]MBB4083020.1 hypothetical protein [Brevundimonas lenta]